MTVLTHQIKHIYNLFKSLLLYTNSETGHSFSVINKFMIKLHLNYWLQYMWNNIFENVIFSYCKFFNVKNICFYMSNKFIIYFKNFNFYFGVEITYKKICILLVIYCNMLESVACCSTCILHILSTLNIFVQYSHWIEDSIITNSKPLTLPLILYRSMTIIYLYFCFWINAYYTQNFVWK